jgi:hypothetical protein
MDTARRPPKRATAPEGDFYVEPDCCLLCGVPEDIAPEIFRTDEDHCSVVRQPCSQGEIDRTIRAMWSSEVDCVRYRGHDASMFERLAQAGMADQADHATRPSAPLCLRDRVTFEISDGTRLAASASEIASAFRADMRAKGDKVLPALFGGQSVWMSWYRYRFHLVRFTEAGDGLFVAQLWSLIAIQGLAWRVDDWLRAKRAECISWTAGNDRTSASPTPM